LRAEYEKSYVELYGAWLLERQGHTTVSYCINTEEELLLFTLLSLKSGLTYDLLGLVCGMNGSNAKRNQTLGLRVLERTLERMGHAPKRHIESVEELEACFPDTKELLIDATEQRIQRSSLPEVQKAFFSGKKCHTVKSMIISEPSKRIGYISQYAMGKLHDYRFLKHLFPPQKNYFENFHLRVDLGFLGIVKDYLFHSS